MTRPTPCLPFSSFLSRRRLGRNLACTDQLALAGHVGLEQAGHDLYKEHNANHTEGISHGVTQRNHTHLVGGHCLDGGLGCRESGGGGQCARQDTGGVSRTDPGDQRKDNGNQRTHQNDQRAHGNIGLGILFQVAEELGAGNAAYGGDKEHQAHVADETEDVDLCIRRIGHVELGKQGDLSQPGQGAQVAEEQGEEENARRAQAQPLHLDAADGVADEADQEGGKENHRSRSGIDQFCDKFHDV